MKKRYLFLLLIPFAFLLALVSCGPRKGNTIDDFLLRKYKLTLPFKQIKPIIPTDGSSMFFYQPDDLSFDDMKKELEEKEYNVKEYGDNCLIISMSVDNEVKELFYLTVAEKKMMKSKETNYIGVYSLQYYINSCRCSAPLYSLTNIDSEDGKVTANYSQKFEDLVSFYSNSLSGITSVNYEEEFRNSRSRTGKVPG